MKLSSYLGLEETEDNLLSWLEHYKIDAKKIDVVSRVMFPLSFLLFTASYWIYYTQTSPTEK